MDELLERYSQSERAIIKRYFDYLAKRTRKSGKISEGVKKNQLIKWQKYEPTVVITALQVYMQKNITVSMNEKYVMGIIRNLHKEKEADRIGEHKQGYDEGKRLSEKYAAESGSTECDF